MKILFTSIFILLIAFCSFAQRPNNQKSISFVEKTAVEGQSFTMEKVYPNPVKDYINIDFRSNTSGPVEISLINILGTEVKKWNEFSLSQGDQKVRIDLSEFKSGVYILRVTKQDQVRTQVVKKN